MKEVSHCAACPKCGRNDEVIPIIYSCSTSDYERYRELEKEGKVLMAGCILSVETPKFYCKRCKYNIWPDEI
jgi:4-hydroxy-3-methylbut-2-en-1-yl diphosphate synthase IspG/GcpE